MSKPFCIRAGDRLQIFALVIAVAVVFGNSLYNGFVWDDTMIFINHEPYRNFDLKRILLSSANGLEYLPVRDLTIALDHLLWGQKPFGFHLTNVVIYMLVVVSFFLVLRQSAKLLEVKADEPDHQAQLSTDYWIPFLAALLYAVHPIHAEAVNFITSRNTLLAGLFYLLSLLLFLRHLSGPGRRRYILSLLLFAAALLSKATSVALPIVLFLVCRLCGIGVKRLFRLTIPFGAVACILAALHIFTAAKVGIIAGSPVVGWNNFLGTAATAFQIPMFYLGKLLYPVGLTIEYQWPPAHGLSATLLVGSTLLWCLLLFFGWKLWDRNPAGAVAVILFLVNLFPVMNLLPTIPVVADRYAFLPSLGFSLGLALLLTSLFKYLRKPAVPVATTIIVFLSVLSFRQNSIWKSDVTLFEHAIRHAPATTRLVTDLGRIYFFDHGNYAKAFELFRKAGEMDPNDPNYDYFRGFVCLNLSRDISCARENLTHALRKSPDFIEALFYLGVISELEGDTEGAITLYRRATESPMFDISLLKLKAAEKYRKLTSPLGRAGHVQANQT